MCWHGHRTEPTWGEDPGRTGTKHRTDTLKWHSVSNHRGGHRSVMPADTFRGHVNTVIKGVDVLSTTTPP